MVSSAVIVAASKLAVMLMSVARIPYAGQASMLFASSQIFREISFSVKGPSRQQFAEREYLIPAVLVEWHHAPLLTVSGQKNVIDISLGVQAALSMSAALKGQPLWPSATAQQVSAKTRSGCFPWNQFIS